LTEVNDVSVPLDSAASPDEYELTLSEGVEDDTLRERPLAKKFEINSYGADYTVDTLVKRMRDDAFKVPEFQRQYVWTLKHASKFIESLLMGLPVPGIFLYKEKGTNQHLVIDGQQRLRTLQAFYDGIFRDKVFKLTGVRDPWDGARYVDLDSSDVRKLDDSVVHATIFQQEEPEDVLDSIYFVFERINTGGIRLSPQEIRNCISLGRFITTVKRANKDTYWRSVFGAPNNRAKDEELIVRFCALYIDGNSYKRPMNKFLNDFSDRMNKLSEQDLIEIEKVFKSTIYVISQAIGTRAFRLIRALNAAVFDSVMVGLAKRISVDEVIDHSKILQAYDNLLENPAYRAACERSTADEENVRVRQTLAIQAFGEV
jgi:Protein of unknown function DUF262